jgi:hypothetical protein
MVAVAADQDAVRMVDWMFLEEVEVGEEHWVILGQITLTLQGRVQLCQVQEVFLERESRLVSMEEVVEALVEPLS